MPKLKNSKRKKVDLSKTKKNSKSKKLKLESDEEEEEQKNKKFLGKKIIKLEPVELDEEKKPLKKTKSKSKQKIKKEETKNSNSKKKTRVKSESKRSSRTNSIEKRKKPSIKINKNRPYFPGKYNINIVPIKKCSHLQSDSKDIFSECCVYCTNRNCIRAALTKNYNLFKKCIENREKISSIFLPWCFNGKNALQIAIENNDKKLIEIILDYYNSENKVDNNKKPRTRIEPNKIQLIDSGENSKFMVGTGVRKLNTTRGNKMGNNALIFDDIDPDNYTSNYQISEKIIETIMKSENLDSSIIDYIKAVSLDPSNSYQRLNFDFENELHKAIRCGNVKIAKYILEKVQGNFNYGFNQLHSDVLNLKKAEDITVKVRTSLTKRPQTNLGITPMHVASINPDYRFLKKLVELGGDWNVLDLENRKPFHYAAACEDPGPLNYLISLGALIDEVDKNKFSALMIASMNNRVENVKILIGKKANFLLKDKINKNTAFHYACEFGHKKVVKYFIENTDIKIDFPGKDRMTGLMMAVLNNHKELIEYLLENNAKIKKKDKFKRNALIHAIRVGNSEIASILLSKGAEFDAPDSSKNYPLHYACAYGWSEIVEMLIKAGANVNIENDWRVTPLEISFLKNHFYIVKYLLDNGCDVNTKFNLDNTLLHYCFSKINSNTIDEIKYFIYDKNADINIQNFHGISVIHILAKFNFENFINDNNNEILSIDNNVNLLYKDKLILKHEKHEKIIKELLKILCEKNVNFDLITKEGKTPFQIALEKNNIPFIKEMLNIKPDFSFRDSNGNTIFHLISQFVFSNDKDKNDLVWLFIKKIKENMSNDDLQNFNNSLDNNGFTPLLKLMYEYYNSITKIYDSIYNSEIFSFKQEIYEEKLKSKEVIQENIKIEKENDDENLNEEEEEEEEEEFNSNKKNNINQISILPNNNQFSFNNQNFNNNFGNFNYNNRKDNLTYEQKIQQITLTQKDIDNVLIKTKNEFNLFLENFLSLLKEFISLNMNPNLKVNKFSSYRINPINANERKNLNENKKLKIHERIENQYFNQNGKNTILIYLMKYPNLNILKYFINDLKLNVNELNLYKQNCLFYLIENLQTNFNIDKNYDLCENVLNFLIKKKINVHQIDCYGNNLFYLCGKNNIKNENILEILYNNKINVNLCNKKDDNLLIHYIKQKNLPAVKILLEKFNCDINFKNSKNRTCFHYLLNDLVSTTDLNEDLLDYLLSKNPDLNIKDFLERSPIFYLFIKINNEYDSNLSDPISILQKLLEYEIDYNISDYYGNTILHYACQRGSIISILTLINKKMLIDVENKEKNSPFAYALLFKQVNVCISLLQQNINLDRNAFPIWNRNENEIFKKLNENNKHFLKTLAGSITSQILLNSSQNDLIENDVDNNNNKKKRKNKKNDEIITIEEDESDKEKDEYEKEIDGNKKFSSKKKEVVFEDYDDDNYYYSDSDENSNDDDASEDNNNFNFNFSNNNPFNMNRNNKGGFGNNYKILQQNKIKNRFNNNNNFKNFNKNISNKNDNNYNPINKKYFITEKQKKNGIKLFRICIRNEFEGLTYLFLSKNYPLMSSVEDSLYEQKFNLALKLLKKSPKIEIYCEVNSEKQNLFHILGNVSGKINSKNDLNQFFEILYNKNISLKNKDVYGNLPIHYACQNNFYKFAEFILSKEKKNILNEENNDNCTPLLTYVKYNNLYQNDSKNFIKILFSKEKLSNLFSFPKYDDSNDYKLTLLIFLVRQILKENNNDYDNNILKNNNPYKLLLNKLLENKIDLNQKDSLQKNCFMYCVEENNLEFLKYLIEKDKNKNIIKNSSDLNKKTLINLTIALNDFGSYENTQMLQFLLENNFDYNLPDSQGKSPIDYAINQQSGKNLTTLKKFVPEFKKYKLNIPEKNIEIFDNVYDYQKDSNDYFELMKKNISTHQKKLPNLFDLRSEQYELYKENDEYWEASLTKVNIQNGVYGEYMFYFIQLIHDLGKNIYIVTTEFGRIGEEGANQRSPFNDLSEAKKEFEKIFKQKTGNLWENRENFERVKGKYMLLKFNKVKMNQKELLKKFDYDICKFQSTNVKEIYDLLKIFTDSSIYFKAIRESGINTEYFNFSMLNKDLLNQAKKYMKEIYTKVKELEELRKNRTDLLQMKKDLIEEITNKTNEIIILSNYYYELIPKEKYKNQTILPFDRLDDVKNEILLLENLTQIETAVSILLAALGQQNKIHPLDYIYNCLQTKFNLIEKDSNEFQIIQKYINNSSNETKIKNLFGVIRKGETEKISKLNLNNHFLLFHGTKIFNYLGIFSNGLKIAPPEAPSTGYLFGKGIYLADMFAKSINYCDEVRIENKSYSYILLCEAALGEIYECDINSYKETNSFLSEGFNSLKSKSSNGPDLNKTFVCNNGIKIPLGNIISYNINKNSFGSNKVSTTMNPEYIVYNTDQVKIRYIIQIERN